MHFPSIHTHSLTNGFEAVAALRVASLVKSDLLIDSYYNSAEESHTTSRIQPAQLQYCREALLAAIADWPRHTTLELRITVTPDVAQKNRSRIDFHLLLRCLGDDEASAKEMLISRYLSLLPVLIAHQPEAIWQPVHSEEELVSCLAPFQATHAVSVHRKRERLSLASEIDSRPLGFLAKEDPAADCDDTIEHLYPWQPSHDDWLRLLETLIAQLDPLQIIIRLKPAADTGNESERLAGVIQRCESFLSDMKVAGHLTMTRQAQMLRDISIHRLAECREDCFHLGVFLVAGHPLDTSLPNIVGWAIAGSKNTREEFFHFKGSWAYAEVPCADTTRPGFIFDTIPYSLMETACAFRLPSPPSRDIPGLPTRRFRTNLATLPPGVGETTDSIKLFHNEHQGMTQPVFIDAEDRMRHLFIMGQTGTGKSTLMETMIVQDIVAGRGLAVIDPHGDMIEDVLLKIPAERADDVILFDLLDRERPLGFNIIQWSSIEERDLIIDELYRTLDHVYDMKLTGGPMFEQHFRNFLKLLMGDSVRPGFKPTILEFIRCYTDRSFRHWLLDSIGDQQVKDFVAEVEDVSGECSLKNVSPYVTSKFSRFVNDTTLKRIVGQGESSVDFDAIMNRGKILLVKLGKGRFGSAVCALLANMLVARFKFAAMKRGEMPQEARRDFFLYVDEAHNLPRENFTELLSEARKYRLGLVLATQYCSQLGSVKGGDDLLAAVFGNVGTTVIFRAGATDAELLAKALVPYFSQLDILGLPNFHGYARMNLNREATIPFSFKTEIDTSTEYPELAPRIRSLSRLKYGQDANLVDAEVVRRSKNWKDAESPGPREAPHPVMPARRSGPDCVNLIVLDMELDDTDLSVRTTNCLRAAGLATIRDLVRCTPTELFGRGNFGRKAFNEVNEYLAELGCSLREEQEPVLEDSDFDYSSAAIAE